MVSGVAVRLEDPSGLVEVVLYHRQVLAYLVARDRVPLAAVAVALERAHPAGVFFFVGSRMLNVLGMHAAVRFRATVLAAVLSGGDGGGDKEKFCR